MGIWFTWSSLPEPNGLYKPLKMGCFEYEIADGFENEFWKMLAWNCHDKGRKVE